MTDPFLDTWDRQLAAWCVDDLMPEGLEAAVLLPLAAYRWAAAALVEHAGQSDDFRHRKLAAILAGFIENPPHQLLDDIFERESERGALAPPETSEALYSQSVVEDVTLAAVRWCQDTSAREAGLALLRKVVERTLIGEYWGSASYALAALRHFEPDSTRGLLDNFVAFAMGAPPTHPANPTLGTERQFARMLRSGHSEAWTAVSAILDKQMAAATDGPPFAPPAQNALDTWLAAAQRIG